MNKHCINYFTTPNIITLFRILLIPLFVILAGYGLTADFPYVYPATVGAFLLFVAIRLTDILDGWVARSTNSVSVLGSYLDVWADFLFVLCSFTMLNFLLLIPSWMTLLAVYKFFEFLILSEVINKHFTQHGILSNSVIHYDIPGRIVSAAFYLLPSAILFLRLLCIDFYLLDFICYGILLLTIMSSILKFASVRKTLSQSPAELSRNSL